MAEPQDSERGLNFKRKIDKGYSGRNDLVSLAPRPKPSNSGRNLLQQHVLPQEKNNFGSASLSSVLLSQNGFRPGANAAATDHENEVFSEEESDQVTQHNSFASRALSAIGFGLFPERDNKNVDHDKRSAIDRHATAPRPWTPEEDEMLRNAVKMYGSKKWKQIATHVRGRNHTQCLQRWSKVLQPGLKKGQWNSKEDELLINVALMEIKKNLEETRIKKKPSSSSNTNPKSFLSTLSKSKSFFGIGMGSTILNDNDHPKIKLNWGRVARHIHQRTAKQCRERWVNNLDPEINKGPWSEPESNILLHLQQKYPKKWAMIAKFIPGRTENSVKIKYKSLTRGMNESGAEYKELINTVKNYLATHDFKNVLEQLKKEHSERLDKLDFNDIDSIRNYILASNNLVCASNTTTYTDSVLSKTEDDLDNESQIVLEEFEPDEKENLRRGSLSRQFSNMISLNDGRYLAPKQEPNPEIETLNQGSARSLLNLLSQPSSNHMNLNSNLNSYSSTGSISFIANPNNGRPMFVRAGPNHSGSDRSINSFSNELMLPVSEGLAMANGINGEVPSAMPLWADLQSLQTQNLPNGFSLSSHGNNGPSPAAPAFMGFGSTSNLNYPTLFPTPRDGSNAHSSTNSSMVNSPPSNNSSLGSFYRQLSFPNLANFGGVFGSNSLSHGNLMHFSSNGTVNASSDNINIRDGLQKTPSDRSRTNWAELTSMLQAQQSQMSNSSNPFPQSMSESQQ